MWDKIDDDVKMAIIWMSSIAIAVLVVCFCISMWNSFVEPNLKLYRNKVEGEATVIAAKYAGEAAIIRQDNNGKARLAESINSRKVLIEDAKSKEEAAKYLNKAEVIRAEGLAEAIGIIGKKLEENKSYLQYLFIDHLEGQNPTTIYIPHGLNMPIQEASRFSEKK